MKKEKTDKLEAQRRRIMAAIWKREAIARTKKNRVLVGKFFRYRNSYSGGTPSWWLYVATTGLDENGGLQGWSFQDDTQGRRTIELNRGLADLGESYREITRAEFAQAWKEFRIGLPNELGRRTR